MSLEVVLLGYDFVCFYSAQHFGLIYGLYNAMVVHMT